jgi:hypothetical protein
MKKTVLFSIILVSAVFFCFTLVSVQIAIAEPIWQIFKNGKDKPVKWVDAENQRFAVYDNDTPTTESDDVVLDKETGLIWDKIPGTELKNWYDANYLCIGEDAGGRMGWRLPTVEELLSLRAGTGLPNGHPFSIIDDSGAQPSYWSSTTDIQNANAAYPVCFAAGCLYEALKANAYNYVWCVRGGYGYNSY